MKQKRHLKLQMNWIFINWGKKKTVKSVANFKISCARCMQLMTCRSKFLMRTELSERKKSCDVTRHGAIRAHGDATKDTQWLRVDVRSVGNFSMFDQWPHNKIYYVKFIYRSSLSGGNIKRTTSSIDNGDEYDGFSDNMKYRNRLDQA